MYFWFFFFFVVVTLVRSGHFHLYDWSLCVRVREINDLIFQVQWWILHETMPNLHNTFLAIDKIEQKFRYLLRQSMTILNSVYGELLKQSHPHFTHICFFGRVVVFVVIIIVLNKKMNRKFPYYYFNVLITYLLAYLICSNATTYRKSNNPSQNLFPLSLIHINDFHARYTFWLNLCLISRVVIRFEILIFSP